jgi:peptide/nickel transport system permease protein
MMKRIKRAWAALKTYPSAVIALGVIGLLLLTSLWAAVSLPLPYAVDLWRGSDAVWEETPKNAAPAWTNFFRSEKLPETIIVRSETLDPSQVKTEAVSATITKRNYDLVFEYPYSTYPQEINVFFDSDHKQLKPQVAVSWITPDGREIPLFKNSIGPTHRYPVAGDRTLRRNLGDVVPTTGLFFPVGAKMDGSTPPPIQNGQYKLRVETIAFEAGTTVNVRLIVYGQVHGLAGTDHMRRDLLVGLLWGTPIALMFGLVAACGTSILTFVIAAIGAYKGGWIDAGIQRVTEVNIMLPALPILIMIATFYSASIMTVLGIIIVLGIFGAQIKTNRAMFLQVKNAPYIEAARAYGAKDSRIIFRYLIPRVAPTLIPGFVTLVPALVFTEASLAVLGLGDPSLPTWGKMLNDAYQNGALYQGQYYWVVEPAVMLIITGLAFSMLGYALDRILNPRLRGQ